MDNVKIMWLVSVYYTKKDTEDRMMAECEIHDVEKPEEAMSNAIARVAKRDTIGEIEKVLVSPAFEGYVYDSGNTDFSDIGKFPETKGADVLGFETYPLF